MASPSKMPRGTRSGRNLDSAREKMLEGMKGICFLATRRAMHCCQFWAVISSKVRSMGAVIISRDSGGKWGVFGGEVGGLFLGIGRCFGGMLAWFSFLNAQTHGDFAPWNPPAENP